MVSNLWILGNSDISIPLAIRKTVFSGDLGLPNNESPDAFDPQAVHLIVLDDGRPAATGRVYHDGRTFRIGKCAVLRERRGKGIGDLLIKLLLLKAFEFDPGEVRVHAIEHAIGFYKKYGFRETGEPFIEDTAGHITMTVTKETLVVPSGCGEDRGYKDFFPDKA
jgi:predicted GNAT family N-acyltransferase